MDFNSVEEEIEFLIAMAGIYPGDPDDSIMKYVAELRGVPFEPIEVIVEYL